MADDLPLVGVLTSESIIEKTQLTPPELDCAAVRLPAGGG